MSNLRPMKFRNQRCRPDAHVFILALVCLIASTLWLSISAVPVVNAGVVPIEKCGYLCSDSISQQPCYSLGNQLQIDTLFVVGDSLSSDDHTFQVTNGQWPRVQFYPEHRFTDRWNYVDFLAQHLHIGEDSIVNYAIGSATTDSTVVPSATNLGHTPVPGIRQQIDLANSAVTINPKSTMFLLWAGANDYFFAPEGTSDKKVYARQVASRQAENVQALIDTYPEAALIVTANLPDMGVLPALANDQAARTFSAHFNRYYAYFLYSLRRQYPAVNIILLDTFSIVKDITTNFRDYGLDSIDKYCVREDFEALVEGMHPDDHLFYDVYHFTSKVHQILADRFFDDIQPQSSLVQ
jgi:phospholipase/lecithinase/hemolysin